MLSKSEGNRSVARARAGDRVGHSRADQFVHEDLDRREGAVDRDHLRMAEVVFLPGFMQHADTWAQVAAAVGESYPVRMHEFASWTFEERIAEIEALAGSVLVGYSMGGRLALHAATRTSFAALATIGSSAGIDDPSIRSQRSESDLALADWIEAHSIEEVVDRWEQNPVFASQPPELVAAQRPGRLDHSPENLASLL